MRETRHNPEPFNLETAFELYNDSLLRTAIGLLRHNGVKNPETVGPDIVQNAYVYLAGRNEDLPNNRTELSNLLRRCVQGAVQKYIEDDFNTESPNPRKMRESHLLSLTRSEVNKRLQVPPNQKVEFNNAPDLKTIIMTAPDIIEKDKKVFIELFINGKKENELARKWDVSPATINSRKNRVLRKLKNYKPLRKFLEQTI